MTVASFHAHRIGLLRSASAGAAVRGRVGGNSGPGTSALGLAESRSSQERKLGRRGWSRVRRPAAGTDAWSPTIGKSRVVEGDQLGSASATDPAIAGDQVDPEPDDARPVRRSSAPARRTAERWPPAAPAHGMLPQSASKIAGSCGSGGRVSASAPSSRAAAPRTASGTVQPSSVRILAVPAHLLIERGQHVIHRGARDAEVSGGHTATRRWCRARRARRRRQPRRRSRTAARRRTGRRRRRDAHQSSRWAWPCRTWVTTMLPLTVRVVVVAIS